MHSTEARMHCSRSRLVGFQNEKERKTDLDPEKATGSVCLSDITKYTMPANNLLEIYMSKDEAGEPVTGNTQSAS